MIYIFLLQDNCFFIVDFFSWLIFDCICQTSLDITQSMSNYSGKIKFQIIWQITLYAISELQLSFSNMTVIHWQWRQHSEKERRGDVESFKPRLQSLFSCLLAAYSVLSIYFLWVSVPWFYNCCLVALLFKLFISCTILDT